MALKTTGKTTSGKAASAKTATRAKPGKAVEMNFQTTTKDSAEFRTWFRGEHTNFNPTVAKLLDVTAAKEFVLKGWVPEVPLITPATQITAFGSCFAANISNWLSKRNFRVLNKDEAAKNAYVVTCGEGMVNSFVIRQQFEWAWENKTFEGALWHGYNAEDYGYDPAVQAETKRIFDATDVFILTFGLSEVWYDEVTGNVFWRTIPKDVYDPSRHKFRVSTVQENKDNLAAIYALIRKHRPDAKIIFTLSPIPLIATFRDNSCLTSNSVSKAVLRVAIDEVVREKAAEGVLHYWPSYELVADVFQLPYKADRRHMKEPVLDYIMTLFETAWCTDIGNRPPLAVAWAKALASAGVLPEAMAWAVVARRPFKLRQWIKNGPRHEDEAIDKAQRKLAGDVLLGWQEEDRQAAAAQEVAQAAE